LLLLLRKRPGITVAELAQELQLTGMGVRRHLDALASDGLVETVTPARRGLGRPASGWRLTATGLELFPRRYDTFALDVLEDLTEHGGPEAVDAVFDRRGDKLVAEYEEALAGCRGLQERVEGLAQIRDGELVLTENNCAVHKVAESYPAVCAMELDLLRRVMGDDVEVTRIAHTMAGDAVCSYRIRKRSASE